MIFGSVYFYLFKILVSLLLD